MKKRPMLLLEIPVTTTNLIYHTAFVTLLVGAAVVLFSAAALVWSGSIRDRSTAAQITRLEVENAQATASARKAQDDAAEATRLLAQANATADAAQKEAAAAKMSADKVAPLPSGRQVTLDNRELFIDFVKTVAKGRVVVEAVESDPEATAFARQVSDMLQGAGYMVSENFGSTVLLGKPPVGVEMRIRSLAEQPMYAGSLQSGLEFIGIPTSGALDSTAGDSVIIFVGTRP